MGTNLADLRLVRGPQIAAKKPKMPSARYYRGQAKALLAWSKATKDKAYATLLRSQAAKELERAEDAQETVADLNPILAEFNEQQLLKSKR